MFAAYRFRDPSLLQQALTRRSYVNDASGRDTGEHNERLEFLGDAVVALLVRRRVYQALPEADQGGLHNAYANFVNRKALADLARRLELPGQLRSGRGDQIQGIHTQDKALEDAAEAVAGALFLDGGLEAAEAVLGPELDRVLAASQTQPDAELRDAKSRLQEWCQARGLPFGYDDLARSGPDHQLRFEVAVRVGPAPGASGQPLTFRGSGNNKKEAEKAAAAVALSQLEDGFRGVEADLGGSSATAGPGDAGWLSTSLRSPPPSPRKSPNARNALQERCQALGLSLPAFSAAVQNGPPHLPSFEVTVTVEGQTFGPCRGNTKKEAEKIVAALALERLDPERVFDFVGRR